VRPLAPLRARLVSAGCWLLVPGSYLCPAVSCRPSKTQKKTDKTAGTKKRRKTKTKHQHQNTRGHNISELFHRDHELSAQNSARRKALLCKRKGYISHGKQPGAPESRPDAEHQLRARGAGVCIAGASREGGGGGRGLWRPA
jgi:hypothetical protein